MKVLKPWFNAWTTSSRMGGAHYIYPCLSGYDDSCDRLGHYLICPMMFSLCKFMHRDLSIHPTDRWGPNSPDKATIIHMCCVFSAYHATAAHVKQNHDTYGTANQSQKLLNSVPKEGLEYFRWSLWSRSSWLWNLLSKVYSACNLAMAPQLRGSKIECWLLGSFSGPSCPVPSHKRINSGTCTVICAQCSHMTSEPHLMAACAIIYCILRV